MRRTHAIAKTSGSPIRTEEYRKANVPILSEVLFAVELVLLHAAPLYYGLGIPHGDGSAVILLPAFLCPDAYLTPLHQWLARIGYNPYFSGIGFNNECPNLLIKQQLNSTIEKALDTSGRKVHLIGHSLGGIIARALAAQRPSDVASVITLGRHFVVRWPMAAFCRRLKWFDAVFMPNTAAACFRIATRGVALAIF
jgi:pimeloyl-ACP methyl ester carboxylesterase